MTVVDDMWSTLLLQYCTYIGMLSSETPIRWTYIITCLRNFDFTSIQSFGKLQVLTKVAFKKFQAPPPMDPTQP
jgi:hypothetical protein